MRPPKKASSIDDDDRGRQKCRMPCPTHDASRVSFFAFIHDMLGRGAPIARLAPRLLIAACLSGCPLLPIVDAEPPDVSVSCCGDAGELADNDGGASDGGNANVDGGGESDGGVDDAGFVAEPQAGTLVTIENGPIQGTDEDGLRVFRGIPYAEPPIGDRRFRAPVPRGPWSTTHDASTFGAACPQQNLGNLVLGDVAISEDCLTLNIWAHDDGVERPVMVFFYGGAFIMGAASQPLYDGRNLAINGDVTVVTVNYRLGALGWLASADIADDLDEPSSGNYGLMDQMEALRFVKKNIAAVGGDPENVTIFGESAGAISVCALLGAPSADDLFEKAIVESGMCALSTYDSGGLIGMPSASELATLFVDEVGCGTSQDVANCLRALPADDLVAATSLFDVLTGDLQAVSALSPIVDGILVTEQPIDRLRSGSVDKPIIAGSNRDEGLLFTNADIVVGRPSLRSHIADLVGDGPHVDEIMDLYPFEDFPIAKDAWTALLGEATFICPTLEIARASSSGEPAFAYHFVHAPLTFALVGVPHGIELPYVFGNFDALALLPSTTDTAVSDTLQLAWSSFARNGAPAASLLWIPYGDTAPAIALVDDTLSLTNEIRNGRCEGLKSLGIVY